MPEIDRLKDRLLAKLQESRASEEIQNLSGQYFAGTIWWTVARGLGSAAAILGGLWGILLVAPLCTQSCLVLASDSCCWSTVWSFAVFGALALIVFGGSFLATKTASDRHFQQSALVSTFVLLGVSVAGIVVEFPTILLLGLLFLIFLLLFWGYRLGL